jgi:hypothetical protein
MTPGAVDLHRVPLPAARSHDAVLFRPSSGLPDPLARAPRRGKRLAHADRDHVTLELRDGGEDVDIELACASSMQTKSTFRSMSVAMKATLRLSLSGN